MTIADITPAFRHGNTAVSSEQARAKMLEYVRAGVARASRVVENIMTVVPQDRLIKAPALTFEPNATGVEYIAPGVRETLHRNALGQMAQRLDMPMSYVDHLLGQEWGPALLARDLREHVSHSDDRWLFRSVGGQARAVLSDKFRRIDVRPVAEVLIDEARQRNMIVSDGVFTDTRTSLKLIDPNPIEVFPGEWMVFGLDWSNSDFGRGANDLRSFLFRLICMNGAVGESVVRQVHIGRRLDEDISYSDRTMQLDSEATVSALRDAARHAMSEVRVSGLIEGIKAADGTKVDVKGRAESLRKGGMSKADTESVVEVFNTGGIEQLPAGNTLWRWSNAISWVAGQLDDGQADKRIDLERLAGEVLRMPKAA